MLERNEYMIKGSLTDKILSLTNRLHEAKNTKTLEKGEFSELLNTVSEYICRGIKNNKIKEEDAMDIHNDYFSQFSTENRDKFFSFPHDGLKRAYKMFSEGITVALMETDNRRKMMSQPVMDSLIDDEDHRIKTL